MPTMLQTGKRAWRFYTVAGPDEPGGQTWPKGSDAYLSWRRIDLGDRHL